MRLALIILAVMETLANTAPAAATGNPTTVLRTYGHMSPQIRESDVRQRLTMVSEENALIAKARREALREWRASLHGGDWREYAKIHDVRDPEQSWDRD